MHTRHHGTMHCVTVGNIFNVSLAFMIFKSILAACLNNLCLTCLIRLIFIQWEYRDAIPSYYKN